MKLMRVQDAVGQVLCHDITQIIPGVTKDAVFRKGHIIREEDIPVLLSVGKEHIYIWENDETMLHENDAADILRAICQGEHMRASAPKEGKIELTAETDGLLLRGHRAPAGGQRAGRNDDRPHALRLPGQKKVTSCAARASSRWSSRRKRWNRRGRPRRQTAFAASPPPGAFIRVVTTGSEVAKGLIQDAFTPVLVKKMAEYGCEMRRIQSAAMIANRSPPRSAKWQTTAWS